jgi:hypothetical protein
MNRKGAHLKRGAPFSAATVTIRSVASKGLNHAVPIIAMTANAMNVTRSSLGGHPLYIHISQYSGGQYIVKEIK